MEDPRLTAQNLIELDGTYLQDLWVSYWGNGGNAQLMEFDAYLHGLIQQDEYDLRILEWAIEEVLARTQPK